MTLFQSTEDAILETVHGGHNLNSIAGWRRETQARVGNQFRLQVDDDIIIAVFKRFHKAGLLRLTKPKWLGVTVEYSGKGADDSYFFLTATFRAEFTPTGMSY